MNLLESILGAGGGAVTREISRQLGVDESQAQAGLEQLVPALARGMKRNAAEPGGLESLLGALQSGGHQRYVDQPDALGRSETVAEGNAILGHILGSKDVSRNVAGRAASETGLDAGLLQKMLPLVAAAAMGSLEKNAAGAGPLGGLLAGAGSGGSAGMAGVLESFLDSDGDGAVIDDVLAMAKKFF